MPSDETASPHAINNGPPPLPENLQTTKQSWNGWWTLLWAVVVMFSWMTLQGIILVAALYMHKSGLDSQPTQQALEAIMLDGDVLGSITIICALIICPLCYLLGHIKPGWNGWEYLGFKKVGILKVILWLAITFAMGLAFNFLAPYIDIDESPEFMRRAAQSTQYPLLLILGIAVGAPFIEEFIFRGLLFRGWSDSIMGPWFTIILTSLIWTSLHVQYGIIILIWIFLFGIIIGYARHKTGSLWVPIAMHALNNTIASIEVMHLVN